MIKRPLIWMLAAYLGGMYLAWLKLPVLIVIASMIFLLFLLYLMMFCIKNSMLNRKDSFLWTLPVFIFLGYMALNGQQKKPELYSAFDQEIRCELSGTITMIADKPKTIILYLKNNEVTLPEKATYLCESVMISYQKEPIGAVQGDRDEPDANCKEPDTYLIGNQITVQGTLQKFMPADNPGQFNEQLYYQIENIDFKMTADTIAVTDAGYSKFHAVLGYVRNKLARVYTAMLSEKEAGTLIAMLLGEKYLLDDEIKRLYQENGISHILAISGLHVSLIGMFLFWLLKHIKCPVKFAAFLSIFFIYSYGVLTNFSVSTHRAVIMMVICLLAPLFGKTYDMLSAMALSALIILLQNPLQIASAGFLLSYGAVLGIAVVLPQLKLLFPMKNKLTDSLFISIAAQVTTAPVILFFFYQFPVYSVLINLIILPFITILMLTSILAGILGVIYLPFGVFFIGGANYILKFYEMICRIGSDLPGNLITAGKPDTLKLFVYVCLFAVFLFTANRFHKKSSVFILLAALIILLVPERNAGLEVTFLDVGQGDAIYMESMSGTTYLVDGGSIDVKNAGTYRLQPFLLSQGTDRLDYAILTHSDLDHINGLTELVQQEKIKINNLLLPNTTLKDEAYLNLEISAKQKGIVLQYLSAGDVIKDGRVWITCLHPSIGYNAPDNNSYSTVLSVTYGEFDLLLTGDLQQEGEALISDLLNNQEHWEGRDLLPAKDYDVLKVAHHGSKYSTLEGFLRLIKPELSVISCGKDNYFGHPHAELLERLYQSGSQVMITYETGAVIITTDGKKMTVEQYGQN